MIDLQKIQQGLFFSSRGKLLIFFSASALLYAIYGYVAFSSYGFDDEFTNIDLIEGRSLPEVLAVVQSSDVHPPLSYVFNYLLYSSLGSWSLVRLLTGMALVSVIAWSSWRIWSLKSWGEAMTSMLFIGLSPSILMWGTSLRWYSLYLIILTILFSPPSARQAELRPRSLHLRLIISLVLLGYTGYITIVLAIPIALYYYLSDQFHWGLKRRIISAITSLLVFALIYSHQLFIFFKFHYPNRGNQTGSLVKSLIGLFAAQFSNQGVFPVSTIGLASAIAMSVIFAIWFFYLFQYSVNRRNERSALAVYPISIMAILVSGLAGKFRNFVVVDPLRGLFFAAFLKSLNYCGKNISCVGRLSVAIVFAAQLLGVGNVIAHNGTTKNNWNIPMEKVMRSVSDFSNDCSGRLAVFNHEPLFQWHLRRQGYNVFGPFDRRGNNFPGQKFECIAFLNTYRGSLNKDRFRSMRKESFDLLKGSEQNQELLGFDSDYKLKQKVDPDYPAHIVNIVTAKGSFDASALKSWQTNKHK
jgi:hypothetical protein